MFRPDPVLDPARRTDKVGLRKFIEYSETSSLGYSWHIIKKEMEWLLTVSTSCRLRIQIKLQSILSVRRSTEAALLSVILSTNNRSCFYEWSDHASSNSVWDLPCNICNVSFHQHFVTNIIHNILFEGEDFISFKYISAWS